MRAWLCLVLALGGCGYTSQYHAPIDGRPRAVWVKDHVALDRAGAPLPEACKASLAHLGGSERLRLVEGDLRVENLPPPRSDAEELLTFAFWVPVYWVSQLVPGRVAPPTLPRFVPELALRVALPPAQIGAALGVAAVATAIGGPSGANDDSVTTALLLLVLPAVAVGLAVDRPEGRARNSEAIDQVNAYNDQLRTHGRPCSFDAERSQPW